MLSGLLLIGSNTGRTVELIQDGTTGLLYECYDGMLLAEAIKSVFEDRKRKKAIANFAQSEAVKIF